MSDLLSAALREEILAIVREEIRGVRISTAIEPDVYSTGPDGVLPPVRVGEAARRSRRWTREHAPQIPGAVRSGPRFGRGVVWTIQRPAYERWLASRVLSSTTPEPEAPSNVIDVDAWICKAGYRTTRGAVRR